MRSKRSFSWSPLSTYTFIYEHVLLLVLLAGFDGHHLFQDDDFGGRLVLPTFFVGEEEIVGEHHPSSEDGGRSTGASF